jgi:hypothetical protein
VTPEEVRQQVTVKAVENLSPYLRGVLAAMTPQEFASAQQTIASETDKPEYQWSNIKDWLEPTLHKLYDAGKLPEVNAAQTRLHSLSDKQDIAIIQNRAIPQDKVADAMREVFDPALQEETRRREFSDRNVATHMAELAKADKRVAEMTAAEQRGEAVNEGEKSRLRTILESHTYYG